MLAIRMLFVIEDPGQGIRENRQRFFKGNAMFLQICLGLFRVPLKFHTESVAGLSPFANPVMVF